jgi:hypothetical protein
VRFQEKEMSKALKKENKLVAYLDGEGAFPVKEKEMKKWIKKFLLAEDKPVKRKGG